MILLLYLAYKKFFLFSIARRTAPRRRKWRRVRLKKSRYFCVNSFSFFCYRFVKFSEHVSFFYFCIKQLNTARDVYWIEAQVHARSRRFILDDIEPLCFVLRLERKRHDIQLIYNCIHISTILFNDWWMIFLTRFNVFSNSITIPCIQLYMSVSHTYVYKISPQ